MEVRSLINDQRSSSDPRRISLNEAVAKVFNREYIGKPAWNKRYLCIWTMDQWLPGFDHEAILADAAL